MRLADRDRVPGQRRLGARRAPRGRLQGQPQSPPAPDSLDLYPAEASLLVLFPLLHRVHYLRRAARLAEVRPWSLRPDGDAGPLREAYELFAEESDALVQRALRDPEAEPLVGWWLCHRWLTQREEFSEADSVPALLAELGESVQELGGALAADRVTSLLHALRRGPDVCHPEFLNLLPADDRVRCGPGQQQIRFQRVALLLALAYGMSVELTALPDIVAEHLAIPYPVDLDELRRTLTAAEWGGSRDLPVLRAECRHEAVVEGLREYTARTDAVLHAIRRTARERINQPMPDLPTRLSADGVVPSRGTFDGYARFRGDGRRFLDLAMGIELYKDRGLAVRELYQNALDACRYRRARQEYLDRTTGPSGAPYTGGISFVQDVDEAGRAYVECQDDGIGMGEAELRGVFSHAGERFAEQLEFKLERARWEALDPPLRLFPNSRFGIGVLSYFMLAEEIRVTTCRMDADGVPGPVYEVSICGPGHLFRIVQTKARGRAPGTRVRLYLRADVEPESWSVIDVLESVLAIAEFPTTARHGGPPVVWEPGRLKERERPDQADTGLNAYGSQVPWSEDDQGAQVVWCERGGALLVDGVIVEPTVRKGVVSAKGPGLTGAVVNLRGPQSPAKLSVDRRHVLDDVTGAVRELLVRAGSTLADGDEGLPDFDWLCRVAEGSAALGDIVAAALFSAGRTLKRDGVVFGDRRNGMFPVDLSLVPRDRHVENRTYSGAWGNSPGYAPDHIYLWRILARRPRAARRMLAELCPEIETAGPVLSPTISDQWLLQYTKGGRAWRGESVTLNLIARAADTLQCTSREVAQRLADLGFHDNDPACWADDAELTVGNSKTFESGYGHVLTQDKPVSSGGLMLARTRSGKSVAGAAAFLRSFGFHVTDDIVTLCEAAEKDPLLWVDPEDTTEGCLDPDKLVPLGHIADASIRLGLSVPEVCRRLEAHGLRTAPGRLAAHPPKETPLLLSALANGKPPWLEGLRVPPGQVVEMAEELGLEPSEVMAQYKALGFTLPEPFPADASEDDAWLLYDELEGSFFTPHGTLLYGHVLSQVEDPGDLRYKISRMREYGLDITLEPPTRLTQLDRELLRMEGPINWWFLEMGDIVPFSYVLLAAREVGAGPSAVAKRLRACNIPTSHEDLPKRLSFSEALRLMRVNELPEGDFPEARHFPLEYLHKTALRRRTGIRDIASLLNQLGIPVPDPADTIRAALARVPRPPHA